MWHLLPLVLTDHLQCLGTVGPVSCGFGEGLGGLWGLIWGVVVGPGTDHVMGDVPELLQINPTSPIQFRGVLVDGPINLFYPSGFVPIRPFNGLQKMGLDNRGIYIMDLVLAIYFTQKPTTKGSEPTEQHLPASPMKCMEK